MGQNCKYSRQGACLAPGRKRLDCTPYVPEHHQLCSPPNQNKTKLEIRNIPKQLLALELVGLSLILKPKILKLRAFWQMYAILISTTESNHSIFYYPQMYQVLPVDFCSKSNTCRMSHNCHRVIHSLRIWLLSQLVFFFLFWGGPDPARITTGSALIPGSAHGCTDGIVGMELGSAVCETSTLLTIVQLQPHN